MIQDSSPEKEPSYVIAIDQGTTSARAIAFSDTLKPVGSYQVELTQIYPHAGWVEHDPREVVNACQECMDTVGKILQEKDIPLTQVKAVGISNQRETTILWDKTTGEPIYNAIVWSDIRTEDTVKRLKQMPEAKRVEELSGLHISGYFAGVKVRWMLDELDKAKQLYDQGNLCFGTVDSWLLFKFTGKHVTDITNASRSMFMNIKTGQYDEELIKFFGVEKLILPEIRSSSEVYGTVQFDNSPFKGLPVSGCIADQSSALLGHLGTNPGDVKNTYGTGCFLMYNTGNEPIQSKNGLLTTVAFKLGDAPTTYALEGSIAVAGSIVKWFKNNLGIIETSEQMGELASQVKDSGGVVFVTAFSGLFAPYWRPDARGTIVGMTAYTTRAHLARAALEATCFQTRAILEAMAKDSGHSFNRLKVDGGLTNSNVAMQIQSDILGIPVIRPPMKEPTALGGAIAAGLAVGVWENIAQIKALSEENQRGLVTEFVCSVSERDRAEIYRLWNKAVERSVGWLE